MNYLVSFNIQNKDEEIKKENIQGKYKDNKLSFKYDNESIKLDILKDNIIMEKENNDSTLSFNFVLNKKTESSYLIKDLNLYIDTKVLTNKLLIEDNRIYIEYELYLQDEYSGNFIYEVNIKEV